MQSDILTFAVLVLPMLILLAVQQQIAPMQASNSVTTNATSFIETGLPNGTAWNVTFNGVTNSSSSNTILFFNTLPGNYMFVVQNAPASNTLYLPNPSNGIAASGSTTNIIFTSSTSTTSSSSTTSTSSTLTATIVQQTLTTSFTENGLPSNALWQVSYNNVTENALAPNAIIFTTAPGNYMFVANVPLSNTTPLYVPNQSSGYLVAGNATQILFSQVKPAQQSVNTSFTENGLPSNALWQVSYNNVTENALAPNAIIFTTAPGNYMFVANVPLSNTTPLYVPNQSSGYLVAGNTIQIPFSVASSPAPSNSITSTTSTTKHGFLMGMIKSKNKHAYIQMQNSVLHGVAINFSTDVSFNISVSIKAATNPNFYERIEMNETNVTLGEMQLQPASIDEFVKSATYNFSVPISLVQSLGVSKDNIKLFKYVSGNWLILPTAYTGLNNTDYFYSAVSNSLSTYAVGYVSGNTVGTATPLSLTLSSGYPTYFFSFGGVSGKAGTKSGTEFSDNWTTGTNMTSKYTSGGKEQYNMTNIGYSTARTGTVSNGTAPINISLTGIGANVIVANGQHFYSSTKGKRGSLSYSVATSNSFVILLFASGGSYFSSAPTTTASGCSTVQSVSQDTLASSAIMVCNALSAGGYTASAATSKYSPISIAAYVFPPYTVTLDDNPTTGHMVLGGTTYANGQTASIIGTTTINAIAPSGYTFNNWSVSNSNVIIANTLSPNTIVTVEGNSIITASFVSPATCTVSLSPNAISFGSMNPGTSIGTIEPVTVSNSGNAAANILVYGANWIYGTTSFGVSNTTWSASNNIPWGSANQLTAVATATGLIDPASGSNTIYFGLRVPGGAPANQYTQNIVIENSC